MISPINILMTGAGAPGAPGIIHCLTQDKNIKLTIGDADSNATGKFIHPEFILLPKGDQPGFTEEVLKLCMKHNIQFILPLVTKELLPFAIAKNEFAKHDIQVMVSTDKAIRIANNKSRCYQFLKDQGISVPLFHVVNDIATFKEAAQFLGFPNKPFCFKPSDSNGSRGVRIVSGSVNECDLLFNEKPYHLFMSYDMALDILSSNPFPELLLSAYLPGDEFSVDCLANKGQPKLIIPRIRKKMINGISVQGEIMDHKKIIAYCKEIIQAIGLHGNIGIQVKLTAAGEPMLLEINPRVQGTIIAALGAGANMPLLSLYQEMGRAQSIRQTDIKWGTKFSRFWTEIFY